MRPRPTAARWPPASARSHARMAPGRGAASCSWHGPRQAPPDPPRRGRPCGTIEDQPGVAGGRAEDLLHVGCGSPGRHLTRGWHKAALRVLLRRWAHGSATVPAWVARPAPGGRIAALLPGRLGDEYLMADLTIIETMADGGRPGSEDPDRMRTLANRPRRTRRRARRRGDPLGIGDVRSPALRLLGRASTTRHVRPSLHACSYPPPTAR
jgi:hypothetical protein